MIKAFFHNAKNAWCITNGIRTVWCDPDEYNEAIRELELELENI